MLELLGSAASGGVIGLLGSVVGKVFGLVTQYNEQKFKQQEWDHEVRLLQLQQVYQMQELEKQADIAEQNNATNLRLESYNHDSLSGQGSLWVINILRLIRPVLTIGLIIMVGLIWFHLDNDVTMSQKIIESILFCSSSSLAWWFGDRSKK